VRIRVQKVFFFWTSVFGSTVLGVIFAYFLEPPFFPPILFAYFYHSSPRGDDRRAAFPGHLLQNHHTKIGSFRPEQFPSASPSHAPQTFDHLLHRRRINRVDFRIPTSPASTHRAAQIFRPTFVPSKPFLFLRRQCPRRCTLHRQHYSAFHHAARSVGGHGPAFQIFCGKSSRSWITTLFRQRTAEKSAAPRVRLRTIFFFPPMARALPVRPLSRKDKRFLSTVGFDFGGRIVGAGVARFAPYQQPLFSMAAITITNCQVDDLFPLSKRAKANLSAAKSQQKPCFLSKLRTSAFLWFQATDFEAFLRQRKVYLGIAAIFWDPPRISQA